MPDEFNGIHLNIILTKTLTGLTPTDMSFITSRCSCGIQEINHCTQVSARLVHFVFCKCLVYGQ